jgi:hypothetical protein
MQKIASVVLLALALMGCGPSQELVAQVQAVDRALQEKARSGEISWTEYARKTNDIAINATPQALRASQSAEGQALLAYRVMIAAEIDAKRMTPEQFDFLWKKQVAEAQARDTARREVALESMSTGLIQAGAALSAASRPQVVNCSTTRSLSSLETTCF